MVKYLLAAMLLALSPVLADESLRVIAVGGHRVSDDVYVDIGVRIGGTTDTKITLTEAEAKNITRGLMSELGLEWRGVEGLNDGEN